MRRMPPRAAAAAIDPPSGCIEKPAASRGRFFLTTWAFLRVRVAKAAIRGQELVAMLLKKARPNTLPRRRSLFAVNATGWLNHLNQMPVHLPYTRRRQTATIQVECEKKSRAMFPSRATVYSFRTVDQPPDEDFAGAAVEAAGGVIAVEEAGGFIAVEAAGGVIAGAVDAVAGAATVAGAAAPFSF